MVRGSLGVRTPGEYILDKVLGAGGMGVVHLGWLVGATGRRRVAIKRIGDGDLDRAKRERLLAEADLMFALSHANICRVLDVGVGDSGAFLVMEYVAGLDLGALCRALRKQGETLDLACALYIARETSRALEYAHRASDEEGRHLQLVHGDVTLRNVLLSQEGEVKLSDFGIARAAHAIAPGNDLSSRSGTTPYLAPETLTGALDHRADIYSLGVTLYAALGGPLDAPVRASSLRGRSPELPPEVIAIVERAIAPRERRYASAGDLESDLAFELARRFPGFTPSELGRLVRRHPKAEPLPEPVAPSGTLAMPADDAVAKALDRRRRISSLSAPPHTMSVPRIAPPPVARPRRFALWMASLALVGGSALGVRAFFRPQVAVAPPPLDRPPAPVLTQAPAPVSTPAPAGRSSPRPTTMRTGVGYVSIGAQPWGVVLVDGRRAAERTPVFRLPVPPGLHRVELVAADGGRHSKARSLSVEPGKSYALRLEW